ncbi:MAG: hypothetical protein ACRDV8_12340, partial [Acidimicrobiales bacterium]
TIPFKAIPPTSSYGNTLGAIDGHLFVGASSRSGCALAALQPTSLRIASTRSTSCDDPLVDGENVMPVESVTPRGNNVGEVRIAVRVGTTGSFRLGPVVTKYLTSSDTRPEWTYGGGYLWLYSVGNPGGGSGGPNLPSQVLRISLTTGLVLTRVSMPPLVRITLAADDDGLWFAPSIETVVSSTRSACVKRANARGSRKERRAAQLLRDVLSLGQRCAGSVSAGTQEDFGIVDEAVGELVRVPDLSKEPTAPATAMTLEPSSRSASGAKRAAASWCSARRTLGRWPTGWASSTARRVPRVVTSPRLRGARAASGQAQR